MCVSENYVAEKMCPDNEWPLGLKTVEENREISV